MPRLDEDLVHDVGELEHEKRSVFDEIVPVGAVRGGPRLRRDRVVERQHQIRRWSQLMAPNDISTD